MANIFSNYYYYYNYYNYYNYYCYYYYYYFYIQTSHNVHIHTYTNEIIY